MLNERYLKNLIEKAPKIIAEIFRSYDGTAEPIDDNLCDDLLGISWKTKEKAINNKKLQDRFGIEQFLYEGTPYNYIRSFISILKPSVDDIIYDLGAGYGRVCLYGSLTSRASFKGIELVPERVFTALQAKKKFHIDNVNFIQSNVLDHDYHDGNIFFLFNPFFRETLEKVGEKLKEIAKNKNIKIVTWGGSSNDFFEEQDWLKETNSLEVRRGSSIQFFESNKIS